MALNIGLNISTTNINQKLNKKEVNLIYNEETSDKERVKWLHIRSILFAFHFESSLQLYLTEYKWLNPNF
jgi:hypothetical protein